MNCIAQARQDELGGWLATINQLCGAFDGQALSDDFSGQIRGQQNGALKLSYLSAREARLCRTPREVAQSDSHKYFAVFQLQGSTRMLQGDCQEVLHPGDILLIDSTRPSEFTYGQGDRQLSLILPRERVEQALKFAPVDNSHKIQASSPIALLANQLIHSTADLHSLSLLESEAVLDSLVNLIRPAISRRQDKLDLHERVFKRSLELIDQHIQDESLCPEMIASEIGVSMRGLYRVFAKKGLVIAQYIKNRRLDICAEALRSNASNIKLSALGYAWGFANSSYFTTAFKTRFGISPGEYRKRYA